MTYWKEVPKGIWTITDPTDAINALREKESLIYYDAFHDRVNVLGPSGKAVIIDLKIIRAEYDQDSSNKRITELFSLINTILSFDGLDKPEEKC